MASLERQGEHLAAKAQALETRAAQLQRQGDELQRRADELEAQKRDLRQQAAALESAATALQAQQTALQAEAAQLQRQADALKRQKHQAERQKAKAQQLQKKLTRELTRAGGDKRATDPRIVHLQKDLLATSGVVALTPPQVSDTGDALVLNAIPTTPPASDATASLVEEIRSSVLPPLADVGLRSHVGGYTASYVDLATKISEKLPLVVATVLTLSFLLLLLAFRSLLIPLQAAITNLLSVAASFGVLTAVFQWGWGLSLVGLDAPSGTDPIASYVPDDVRDSLRLIDEGLRGVPGQPCHRGANEGVAARAAVSEGLPTSARVISGAALIMICVFGSFILNGDPRSSSSEWACPLRSCWLRCSSSCSRGDAQPLRSAHIGRFPGWLRKVLPNLGLGE